MVRHVRLAAVLLVVFVGCRDSLPTAPDDLSSGVILYKDANFLGEAAHVTEDIKNLDAFNGPCTYETTDAQGISSTTHTWSDCVSSIRVAPGWRATLYEDKDFKGWAADVGEENVANYQLVRGPCKNGTFNDCASSIRVFRKP